MTLNEYQQEAMQTALYKQSSYPFLALSEEAGEVMGKLAKYVRKHDVSAEAALIAARYNMGEDSSTLRTDLIKELGDVLWQVQACANVLGIRLELLAEKNLEKVHGRAERGTLEGSGDDR